MAVTLHLVGCGRAGRSLARLWADQGAFSIGRVVNRRIESAQAAVDFIGQGRAAAGLDGIAAEDWLMLGVPDGQLESAVAALAAGLDRPPALAFHVSGAEPADVLRRLGCPVASVHPVCPFSDPERALRTFAGSYALGEGDPAALDAVLPAFEAIGAETMRFEPADKRRYHAATIAASNFLNVLDDLALDLAESAGLETGQALKVIVALQRAGLSNIEQAGPQQALTGPIERGDRVVCERLLGTPGVAGDPLFLALARAAVDLADRKHGRQAEDRENPLRELFGAPNVQSPDVQSPNLQSPGDRDGGV
ncbi:MAG: DUF2520 domain-containing protein [Wenzhouxiangellaceae bacterium]|nr:DUF2520 domain-containing protein [Wenzhouxiangellaceae bacterium]